MPASPITHCRAVSSLPSRSAGRCPGRRRSPSWLVPARQPRQPGLPRADRCRKAAAGGPVRPSRPTRRRARAARGPRGRASLARSCSARSAVAAPAAPGRADRRSAGRGRGRLAGPADGRRRALRDGLRRGRRTRTPGSPWTRSSPSPPPASPATTRPRRWTWLATERGRADGLRRRRDHRLRRRRAGQGVADRRRCMGLDPTDFGGGGPARPAAARSCTAVRPARRPVRRSATPATPSASRFAILAAGPDRRRDAGRRGDLPGRVRVRDRRLPARLRASRPARRTPTRPRWSCRRCSPPATPTRPAAARSGWLLEQQCRTAPSRGTGADGRPNSNSTGLAAQALRAAGRTDGGRPGGGATSSTLQSGCTAPVAQRGAIALRRQRLRPGQRGAGDRAGGPRPGRCRASASCPAPARSPRARARVRPDRQPDDDPAGDHLAGADHAGPSATSPAPTPTATTTAAPTPTSDPDGAGPSAAVVPIGPVRPTRSGTAARCRAPAPTSLPVVLARGRADRGRRGARSRSSAAGRPTCRPGPVSRLVSAAAVAALGGGMVLAGPAPAADAAACAGSSGVTVVVDFVRHRRRGAGRLRAGRPGERAVRAARRRLRHHRYAPGRAGLRLPDQRRAGLGPVCGDAARQRVLGLLARPPRRVVELQHSRRGRYNPRAGVGRGLGIRRRGATGHRAAGRPAPPPPPPAPKPTAKPTTRPPAPPAPAPGAPSSRPSRPGAPSAPGAVAGPGGTRAGSTVGADTGAPTGATAGPSPGETVSGGSAAPGPPADSPTGVPTSAPGTAHLVLRGRRFVRRAGSGRRRRRGDRRARGGRGGAGSPAPVGLAAGLTVRRSRRVEGDRRVEGGAPGGPAQRGEHRPGRRARSRPALVSARPVSQPASRWRR